MEDTLERTSQEFPGVEPPPSQLYPLLSSYDGKMDGERQGWDRPLRNDGFEPRPEAFRVIWGCEQR